MTTAKTKVQTTMTFQGINYPFYTTMRGEYDFENAGFTKKQVAEGSAAALIAMTFFQLRDCAKRSSRPLSYSFDEFIDLVEEDDLTVWSKLLKAKNAQKEGEKKIAPVEDPAKE